MSVTRWERDRLRKWCRDMDAADGLVRDESPICIWEELLDALDAADALAEATVEVTDAYEAYREDSTVSIDGARQALAAYRVIVAPATAESDEAAS